jgi:hypothetical protein
MPKKITRAYLAGFVDGEGCIGVYWVGRITPRIQVTIGNTNFQIIHELREAFGGSVTYRQQINNRKPCATIHWTDRKAVDLLVYLKPHLRIKLAAAQNAINFWMYSRKSRADRFQYQGKTPTLREEYKRGVAKFVEETHRLNRKGIEVVN